MFFSVVSGDANFSIEYTGLTIGGFTQATFSDSVGEKII